MLVIRRKVGTDVKVRIAPDEMLPGRGIGGESAKLSSVPNVTVRVFGIEGEYARLGLMAESRTAENRAAGSRLSGQIGGSKRLAGAGGVPIACAGQPARTNGNRVMPANGASFCDCINTAAFILPEALKAAKWLIASVERGTPTTAHQASVGIGRLVAVLKCREWLEESMPPLLGMLRLIYPRPVILFGLTKASAHEIAYHICQTITECVALRALIQVGRRFPVANTSLLRVREDHGILAAKQHFCVNADNTSADGLTRNLAEQCHEDHRDCQGRT
jgi:hypothetical protein